VQLLFAVIATLAITPLFLYGNAGGHDSAFHFSSWVEATHQWREGTFYPRWAGAANYHLGEPRFIFYPPLSWMLGAALSVVFPWKMVPGAFIWLTFVLAGNSMRIFALEFLSPNEATAAGLLYLASPYNFVNAYTRCDFSEFLAAAIFPLLVWAALRKVRDNRLSFMPIAAVLAAIWLTNAPAAVIATYSLWVLLVIRSVVVRSWQPLRTAALSSAAGFALAAFYIFPAAWEQRWVHIGRILPSPRFTDQRFLFATDYNNPDYVYFLLKLSCVAMVMIGGSAIAAVLTRQLREGKPEAWWPVAGLGAASIMLMFPVSAVAWRVLPELRLLQFPWRWLFPLGAVGTFLISSAIHQSRFRRALWMVLGLAIAALGGGIAVNAVRGSGYAKIDTFAVHFARGYRGVVEYLPLSSSYMDQEGLPKDIPDVVFAAEDTGGSLPGNPAKIQVLEWLTESKSFKVDSPGPAQITLRLLAYPAWEVKLNGSTITSRGKEKTGQIIFSVPSGVSLVQVRFKRTWDRWFGIAVSIGTCVVLAFVGIALRRREM